MRFMVRFAVLLSVFSSCAWLQASPIGPSAFGNSPTVITFDDVTGGSLNLTGPSITGQYSALGVTFDNPSRPGQVTVDSNLTFGIPDSSFPNALYVAQGGLLNDPPAAPFQILFSNPVTMAGFDFASSVNAFLEVDVYGINNVLLEQLTFVGQPSAIGLGGFAGVEQSAGITRLDVSYHPNSNPSRTLNFSIDNLEFQTSSADPPSGDPPGSAPEPSTWTFMVLGVIAAIMKQGRRWRRY